MPVLELVTSNQSTTLLLAALLIIFAGVLLDREFRRPGSLRLHPYRASNRQIRREHREAHDLADAGQQLNAVMAAPFQKQKLLNKSEYRVFKVIEDGVATVRKGYRVFAQAYLGEILKSPDQSAYRSINSKRIRSMIAVGPSTVLLWLSLSLNSALGVPSDRNSYTYSYKLTISARDHGEPLTTTGIVLVREKSAFHRALAPQFCGEATPLRLRNGKYLFALLNGPPFDPDPARAKWGVAPTLVLLQRLGLPVNWNWKDDTGIRRLPKIQKIIRLDPDEMPEFVAFKDITQSTSINRINPTRLPGWLSNTVKIESVTLQPTTGGPTLGRVKNVLPWLNPSRDYLDGSKWGRAVHAYHSNQFVQCF